MPTSYTSVLKLALPATGELAGTWGDVVNNNITQMVEQAITGLATINTWTAASHTLTTANGTTSESRCAILECSGAPGAAATVICPAATKLYILKNSITGGYAVTLKTASGTGISVPNGRTALLYCDGTNVVVGVDYAASLALGTPLTVANGGTGVATIPANYVPYGNGTSPVQSSINFQFDGTVMRVGNNGLLGGTTNPIIGQTGAANNYVQGYVYNATNGASSSADFVAYANNSTDAHGWADMGFTSAAYADATYTITGPNEAYLLGSAPSGSTGTGNLVYATDNTGTSNAHQWYVGGFTQAKSAWKMQLTSTGLQLANALAVAYGGTGLTTTPVNGAIDIGNGTGFTRTTLTAGANVTITNGAGSITISATSSGGSVTSVNASGGTTGFSFTGGPVTSSGTLTMTGTLNVANGGTGATTLTGLIKGNGTSAMTAAVAGTDYQAAISATGILKGAGSGSVSAATAGTDYVAPATATNFTATQTFTGATNTLASVLVNAAETTTVSATAATGTINYDVTTQSVLYYTASASANWTVNVRASSGTTLNAALATGQSVTFAFLVTQGATAYFNNAFTVDSTPVTPKWQGGTAPTAGNPSGIDCYTYTIIKTGSATFTVLASLTQYK